MFLENLHVRNMGSAIGAENINVINLCKRAACSPGIFIVDSLEENFVPNQATYLSKFEDE